MHVLGLRCTNRDYAYAVLTGSKAAPSIVKSNKVVFPRGYSRAESLRWMVREIENLFDEFPLDKIVIKRFEGRQVGKRDAFEDRVEHEAAAAIGAMNRGNKAVFKKVSATIAKDLGQVGRARYLKRIDTSMLPDFGAKDAKIQEAILGAWSELGGG